MIPYNLYLGRYKRKENKLKDQFNQLINKYAEAEAADAKLNNELTEDYRSLTQKYKDLQSKFRQFEIADTGDFKLKFLYFDWIIIYSLYIVLIK